MWLYSKSAYFFKQSLSLNAVVDKTMYLIHTGLLYTCILMFFVRKCDILPQEQNKLDSFTDAYLICNSLICEQSFLCNGPYDLSINHSLFQPSLT